jgi:hypothetical protein
MKEIECNSSKFFEFWFENILKNSNLSSSEYSNSIRKNFEENNSKRMIFLMENFSEILFLLSKKHNFDNYLIHLKKDECRTLDTNLYLRNIENTIIVNNNKNCKDFSFFINSTNNFEYVFSNLEFHFFVFADLFHVMKRNNFSFEKKEIDIEEYLKENFRISMVDFSSTKSFSNLQWPKEIFEKRILNFFEELNFSNSTKKHFLYYINYYNQSYSPYIPNRKKQNDIILKMLKNSDSRTHVRIVNYFHNDFDARIFDFEESNKILNISSVPEYDFVFLSFVYSLQNFFRKLNFDY